jgi:hypothetical protein
MLIMIPEITNTQEYKDFLDTVKECIGRETIPIYTKIVGGLKCSTLEQQKMGLAINLMRKIGLECLDSTGSDATKTYLRVFVDYSTSNCRECNFSILPEPQMTTDTPTDPEVTFRFESGNYIKMENGNYLILE